MLSVNTLVSTLRLPGAQVLEQFCAAAPCCPVAGEQCAGLPPLPDELFLTLSGFAAPFVSDYSYENLADASWYEPLEFFNGTPEPIDLGLAEAILWNGNTWANGSYRLRRVTPNEYILSDSVGFPNITGGLISPGGSASHGIEPGYGVYLDNSTGVLTLQLGGTNSLAGLIPFNFAGPLQLSPGRTLFKPDATYDAIWGRQEGFEGFPLSFQQSAVTAWIAWNGATTFPSWPEVMGLWNDAGTLRRSKFAISLKTYKQAYMKLRCVELGGLASPQRSLEYLQLFTYVATTVSAVNGGTSIRLTYMTPYSNFPLAVWGNNGLETLHYVGAAILDENFLATMSVEHFDGNTSTTTTVGTIEVSS